MKVVRSDNKPLMVDLFCGLGGWASGGLAEGYDVVGFDVERHQYGDHRYPGCLVIQDVLTLHGSQFKDATLIVASPPCQEYSYMAMPWKKAKAKAAAIRADTTGGELARLNRLFNVCLRIQLEASVATGRRIPMVIENVKGAQPWVGRARWSFGSFYLWGDVPALMPVAFKAAVKGYLSADMERLATSLRRRLREDESIKNCGGSWFNIGSPGQKVTNRNPVHELGRKGEGGTWFGKYNPTQAVRNTSSGSRSRKAASAMIAKIPLPLSRHIAATFLP